MSASEPPRIDVRGLRSSLGLTQHDLAARLSVHPDTVFKWEHGVSQPSKRLRTRLESLAHPQRARRPAPASDGTVFDDLRDVAQSLTDDPRDQKIFVARYAGRAAHGLAAIGQAFGITHQRVSGILNALIEKARNARPQMPRLTELEHALRTGPAGDVAALDQHFADTLGAGLSIDNLRRFVMDVFGRELIPAAAQPRGRCKLITPVDVGRARRVTRAAVPSMQRYGAVALSAREAGLGLAQGTSRRARAAALDVDPRLEWLDPEHEWFWLGAAREQCPVAAALGQLREALGTMPASRDTVACVRRFLIGRNYDVNLDEVPPDAVLLEMVKRTRRVLRKLSPKHHRLTAAQRVVLEAVRTHGGRVAKKVLRDALVHQGRMAVPTYQVVLRSAPFLRTTAKDVELV